MVIMENCLSQEKIQDLWVKIDQLHLSYLEMEDTTEKISHRSKLEECIAEFLFLAQHRDKFVFAQTEDVLYRSAAFKRGFSAYKAANGWNSLQIYASNLLTQPWRKEYRQIKTYCGYYKHQIDANLVGAETVFDVMGYKQLSNGILHLEGPICPDRVSNISRDCLVAYVECQILKHIWEELSSVFDISWLDILEHRVNYPGNLEQCIKNIRYKYNTKSLPQPIRSSARTESYEDRHNPNTPTSQVSITNSSMSVSNNAHPYAALPSHNHVSLPTVVPSVPYCVPRPNGYPNNFPSFGYGTYPSHVSIVKPSMPVTNGYYYPNGVPAVLPAVYPVPTAQLIELDSRNGYDMVDEGLSSRRRPRIESNGISAASRLASDESYKNGLTKCQEDKPEVEETWDYVYKNLERQGYSKDLGERGDVLGLTVSDKQRKSTKESKKVKATNLDEAMNNMSINEGPLKITKALEQMDKKVTEKNQQTKERRHSQGSSYDNVAPNESSKQAKPVVMRTLQSAPLPIKSTKDVIEKDNSKNNIKVESQKAQDKGDTEQCSKWECKSCTYLNDTSKDICEMCSKSRYIGREQPMEVGGPECSKCTLVNLRNAKVCRACDSSLKNSPTYI